MKLIKTIVFLLILGVALVSYSLCQKDYANFCNGFLGNLLSDFLIVATFGFLFLKYYESKNHPSPTLVVNEKPALKISKRAAKKDGFVLKFGVVNKNRKALQQNDGFYHIYIHKDLSPEVRSGTTGKEKLEKNLEGLKDHVDLHDVNPGPCLYNSTLEMVEIACKLHKNIDKSTIYYYFNTESGLFPKSVKFDKPAIKSVKSWGKLEIEFTD